MTSKAEIGGWFEDGKRVNATHMIVMWDSFDHDDYPIYAHSDQQARELHDDYSKRSMQRVLEVYDLRLDKAAQLDASRAWHLPAASAGRLPTTPEGEQTCADPEPFVDTPVKAAKRKAFDRPTIANLDALIAAVRAERPQGEPALEELLETWRHQALIARRAEASLKGTLDRAHVKVRAETLEQCADDLQAARLRSGGRDVSAIQVGTRQHGNGVLVGDGREAAPDATGNTQGVAGHGVGDSGSLRTRVEGTAADEVASGRSGVAGEVAAPPQVSEYVWHPGPTVTGDHDVRFGYESAREQPQASPEADDKWTAEFVDGREYGLPLLAVMLKHNGSGYVRALTREEHAIGIAARHEGDARHREALEHWKAQAASFVFDADERDALRVRAETAEAQSAHWQRTNAANVDLYVVELALRVQIEAELEAQSAAAAREALMEVYDFLKEERRATRRRAIEIKVVTDWIDQRLARPTETGK